VTALVSVVLLSTTLVMHVGLARGATTLCTPDPGWSGTDAVVTAELLDLLNQHRVLLGLPPLDTSPTLTDAAVWKSRHMAHYGYLSHDDPAPPRARTWQQRVAECGYPGATPAENIAYEGSAAIAMQQWLLSPGHRANIEGSRFRVAGVAATKATDRFYYFVVVFGSDDEAPQPVATESASPALENPDPSQDGSVVVPPEETTASTNVAPVVVGEKVWAVPRRWKTIRVLRNDSDADGDSLVVKMITRRPQKGRVVIDDSKKFIRYRARRGSGGSDRLRYVVADGNGGTASATVRIRIR